MLLELANDIKQDAITIMNLFADGIKDENNEYIVKPIKHIAKIKSIDPFLDNIIFLKEYEDGAAHRDSHHCHLRRTTDRDKELMKIGVSLSIDTVSKNIQNIQIKEEAEVSQIINDTLPPLMAFIDADAYNSLTEEGKIYVLLHLLLRYDPVKLKPKKPELAVFIDELLVAGRNLKAIIPIEEITEKNIDTKAETNETPLTTPSNIIEGETTKNDITEPIDENEDEEDEDILNDILDLEENAV